MPKSRQVLFVPFLAGLATTLMMLVACSSGTSAKGTTVPITEKDFALTAAQTTVAAGKVTFDVHNQGPSTHEFVIVKTDTAAAQLPFDTSSSEVKEDDSSFQHVDEVDDVKSGKDKKLSVDLQPRHYAFICNLPGHCHQGMHALRLHGFLAQLLLVTMAKLVRAACLARLYLV